MDNKIFEKEYSINKAGWDFYTKMKKDTNKSLFIGGPFILLFFTVTFVGIVGWNIYAFYILIFPYSLGTFLFYFHPLILRGRKINAMITKVKINSDSVEVETFPWFFFSTKHIAVNHYNLILKGNSDDISYYPVNCKLELSGGGQKHHVYLVRDFFDKWEEITDELQKLQR